MHALTPVVILHQKEKMLGGFFYRQIGISGLYIVSWAQKGLNFTAKTLPSRQLYNKPCMGSRHRMCAIHC